MVDKRTRKNIYPRKITCWDHHKERGEVMLYFSFKTYFIRDYVFVCGYVRVNAVPSEAERLLDSPVSGVLGVVNCLTRVLDVQPL